jgi:glucose-1-phosphate thymidylyltransferase
LIEAYLEYGEIDRSYHFGNSPSINFLSKITKKLAKQESSKTMKGIILSGGKGTRLYPLTKVTSKQLLPIYDKPMIFYPLQTLLSAGIKDILIIVAPDHCGDYMKVLGSGKNFGTSVRFTYEIQDEPKGLAEAFIIAENFLDDGDNVTMILGDNIFEDDFTEAITSFQSGGRIFAKQVPDPERFGQVKFDDHFKVVQIEEKPKDKISDYAIPGLYIFDDRVVEIAKNVQPSSRGEIEITEVQNAYLKLGELDVRMFTGEWIDAGTFQSLFRATELAHKKALGS